MEFLVAKISIQKILNRDQEKVMNDPKTGLVKAGFVIDIQEGETVRKIKIAAIAENKVTIHVEDFFVKSKTYENPVVTPADLELIPGGPEETLYDTIGNTKLECIIKVLEIHKATEKPPSIPVPKINMPMHFFSSVQEILVKLEAKLQSKVITYYMPNRVMITQNDPDYFAELFKEMKKYPKISLIINSSGGDSMASMRIASLLRHYCDELNIIIPSKATSAATLLSLAADKILFTPLGYLGPIDTQLINITDERLTKMTYSQISSDSFRRAKEMLEAEKPGSSYTQLFEHIHPLVVAEVDRLSSRSKITAEHMMKMQKNPFDKEKIGMIANHLVYDYPSHGFPILFSEATDMGLNAEMLPDDVCLLLWELFKYYKSVTNDRTTNLSTEWYHVEANEVVLEAVGKRLVRRYSFDKKFSLAEKCWQVSNDNSDWKKFLPPDKPNGVPKIMTVEAAEPQSEPPDQIMPVSQ